MLNFYVILAGHFLVTDADKTTTCRRKTKPHDYKQNYKSEGTFENMGLNGKTVWRFQKKKRTGKLFSTFWKNTVGQQDAKTIDWIPPLCTVRIKLNKTWKRALR